MIAGLLAAPECPIDAGSLKAPGHLQMRGRADRFQDRAPTETPSDWDVKSPAAPGSCEAQGYRLSKPNSNILGHILTFDKGALPADCDN